MKRVMIGLFAHPDDETFGPSGTVAKLCSEGWGVHVVTLTHGESGVNHGYDDLGAVRMQELTEATAELGCVDVHPLDFRDGGLSHEQYPLMKQSALEVINEIIASYDEHLEVSMMSFEERGISGHLDHIAAHFLCENIFWQLYNESPENVTMHELWFYCISRKAAPNTRWTTFFSGVGQSEHYITDRIDVRPWLDVKYRAMDKHVSQKDDAESIKALGDDVLATECFHVVRPNATDQGF